MAPQEKEWHFQGIKGNGGGDKDRQGAALWDGRCCMEFCFPVHGGAADGSGKDAGIGAMRGAGWKQQLPWPQLALGLWELLGSSCTPWHLESCLAHPSRPQLGADGIIAALWEKKWSSSRLRAVATLKVTELLIKAGLAEVCGTWEEGPGEAASGAVQGWGALLGPPSHGKAKGNGSGAVGSEDLQFWAGLMPLVWFWLAAITSRGMEVGCPVLNLWFSHPLLGLMSRPCPAAGKPSDFKSPAGRDAVGERLLVLCCLHLRGTAPRASVSAQLSPGVCWDLRAGNWAVSLDLLLRGPSWRWVLTPEAIPVPKQQPGGRSQELLAATHSGNSVLGKVPD